MTTDNILSLGEARAHQKDDARYWTPLESLKALIRRIEAGEINPCAVTTWYWDNNDHCAQPHYSAAGLTVEQHIALLGRAHQQAIEDWRK